MEVILVIGLALWVLGWYFTPFADSPPAENLVVGALGIGLLMVLVGAIGTVITRVPPEGNMMLLKAIILVCTLLYAQWHIRAGWHIVRDDITPEIPEELVWDRGFTQLLLVALNWIWALTLVLLGAVVCFALLPAHF